MVISFFRIPVLVLIVLSISFVSAQSDTIRKAQPVIEFTGYIDAFYSCDFGNPGTANKRQPFFYNHNRHNQFNVNNAILKFSVNHSRYRANIALHAGTYSVDNYAAEPDPFKNLYEANVGVALSRRHSIWLDVGIIPSHIGFESAVSMDNITLTRSMLAENSPYYLAGAKLTYNPDSKWEVAAIICNGWQRIQPVKGNSIPSFGTQLKFTPNNKVTFNWSTFIGTDDPDSIRRMRYFNNLYAQFTPHKKVSLITGFDIGVQQAKKAGKAYNYWLSPVVIVRYAIHPQFAAAFRLEYYIDKKGVIIPATVPNGFYVGGTSINLDYTPRTEVAIRLEGRWLHGHEKVFLKDCNPVRDNFSVVVSIALKVSRILGVANK